MGEPKEPKVPEEPEASEEEAEPEDVDDGPTEPEKAKLTAEEDKVWLRAPGYACITVVATFVNV